MATPGTCLSAVCTSCAISASSCARDIRTVSLPFGATDYSCVMGEAVTTTGGMVAVLFVDTSAVAAQAASAATGSNECFMTDIIS